MEKIREILQSPGFQRGTAFILLIVFIYAIRGMLNVIILTFIIGFIMDNIRQFFQKGFMKFGLCIHDRIIQSIAYIAVLTALVYLVFSYVPVIINQLSDVFTGVSKFSFDQLEEFLPASMIGLISNLDLTKDMTKYIGDAAGFIVKNLSLIWGIVFELLMAFLLSFLFLWEKDRIHQFMGNFEMSRVSFFYKYYKELSEKFINSFGKMIQLQIIISMINTFLSVSFLMFMGFSNIIGLAFLIFVLGLIPVVGVMISFIPIGIIAFQNGGITDVIIVVVMILLIHALESYVLNPKLTAHRMHLPVFFTFFILLFGEHYFGVWGLLIGIPLFVFVLELMDATPKDKKQSIDVAKDSQKSESI